MRFNFPAERGIPDLVGDGECATVPFILVSLVVKLTCLIVLTLFDRGIPLGVAGTEDGVLSTLGLLGLLVNDGIAVVLLRLALG